MIMLPPELFELPYCNLDLCVIMFIKSISLIAFCKAKLCYAKNAKMKYHFKLGRPDLDHNLYQVIHYCQALVDLSIGQNKLVSPKKIEKKETLKGRHKEKLKLCHSF